MGSYAGASGEDGTAHVERAVSGKKPGVVTLTLVDNLDKIIYQKNIKVLGANDLIPTIVLLK